MILGDTIKFYSTSLKGLDAFYIKSTNRLGYTAIVRTKDEKKIYIEKEILVFGQTDSCRYVLIEKTKNFFKN